MSIHLFVWHVSDMAKLTDTRSNFKPFNYPWAFDAFVKSEQMHWLWAEISMAEDVNDWKNKLNSDERQFLTHLYRFFTQADLDIESAYIRNYLPIFPQPEVRMMLSSFAARECFDQETEVLTDKGWVLFAELLENDLVAQVNPENMELTFAKPLDYIAKPYKGIMHYYKNTRTDICVTPNHRLWLINPHSRKTTFKESKDGKWGRNYLYPVNAVSPSDNNLTTLERLLIAIQADGCIRGLCPSYTLDPSRQNDYSVDFELTKQRKIDKLSEYLKELDLNYSPRVQEGGSVRFTFSLTGLVTKHELLGIKDFSFLKLEGISTNKANQIINELMVWDGSSNSSQLSYYNTNKQAIDKIQAIAILSDYGCTLGINKPARDGVQVHNNNNLSNTKTCYVLTFSPESVRCYPHRVEVEYDGDVYCVSMPKGTVVTRRNGKVSVQGNCIHIGAYSYLVETLGMPDTIYNEFLQYKAMADKHNFVEQFASKDDRTIAQQMAVFSAFSEGMQLFSSFVMLVNFSRFGLMKGMGQVISWSAADESLHCESMVKLFRTFIKENIHIWTDEFKKEIYDIARKMGELEFAFIDLAFGMSDQRGLTKEEVKEFARFLIDRRLLLLGLKPEYKVKKNPLPWVEPMFGLTHTNFFEQRVTDYTKGSLTGSWSEVWGKMGNGR